jgi:hypothetical protein
MGVIMMLKGRPAVLKVWDAVSKESGLQGLVLSPIRDPIALVTRDDIYPARYAIVDLEHSQCNSLMGYVGEGDNNAVFVLRTVPCDFVVPYNLRDKWAIWKTTLALKAIRAAFRFECQYGLRFLLLPVSTAGFDGINRVYGMQQKQFPMQHPSPLGTVILWRDEPNIFAVTPNHTIPKPLPLSDIEFHPERVERWLKDITLDAYLECK